MTSEEIEHAFQQVALSIQQLTQMAVRADERQISVRRQVEERGRLLDEKLAQLAEAQARADEQIRRLLEPRG